VQIGRRVRVAAGVAVLLLAGTSLPDAYAVFARTDVNGANSLAAAATFPTYAAIVTTDNPLFYHRFEETGGSSTAADSSGHGLTGVYGTGYQPARLLLPFDEAAGATAHDLAGQSSPGNDATLSNTTWPAGHTGTAGGFNGTSSYADTTGPGVDTATYFTVSAWVYLTSTASDMVAVSQVDSGNSAFRLEYRSGVHQFAFSMTQSNTAGAAVDRILGVSSPSPNTWYHIVGSYEATGGGTLYLYVDDYETGFAGQPPGVVAHTNTWNATGPIEIGAAKTGTVRGEFWRGRIDDVRLFQAAITATPVKDLYDGFSAGPTTTWAFDEPVGGASTDDLSGSTDTGTLGSGASITAAGMAANGVLLDGTANGYVSGRTAAVNTTRSFTAAAWVYLTDTTADHAAISQGGTIGSSFELGYTAGGPGHWDFTMSHAESMTPVFDSARTPGAAVVTGAWVHLAGVFDDGTGKLSLYVNGAAVNTKAHNSLWNGTASSLQVGRERESGGWVNPWPGMVDDARTWQRALSADEISRLYNGGTAGGPVFGTDSQGAIGALQGPQQGQQTTAAESFSGTEWANGFNPAHYTNPTTFSLECWFRTVRAGGRLISFGNAANGDSTTYDRMLWVNATGNVVFGAGSGVADVVQSPATYFDGAWHHVVATLGPAGHMVLYIDGTSVGTQSTYTLGNYTGMWRWGGEASNGTWPGPTYFTGEIDEVAVYGTELSAQQVAWHYHANH
jgi:hypothetical protein